MKFVIPAGNVKIFARSIFSLAKLGDEIYIEPLDDSLTLRTVNSSRSAFSCFSFKRSFFTQFESSALHKNRTCIGGGGVGDQTLNTTVGALNETTNFRKGNNNDQSLLVEDHEQFKCKLPAKSLLSIFRSITSLEKNIEKCTITVKYVPLSQDTIAAKVYEYDSTMITKMVNQNNEEQLYDTKFLIIMHSKYGVRKTFILSISDCESLQTAFLADNCSNRLNISAKYFHETINSFSNDTEEITFLLEANKLVLRNYVEPESNDGKPLINTHVSFDSDEFNSYEIEKEMDITFCLKEFKICLMFGYYFDLPLDIYFKKKGRPIIFCYNRNEPNAHFEANFTLATLVDETVTSQSTITTVSADVTATSNSPVISLREAGNNNKNNNQMVSQHIDGQKSQREEAAKTGHSILKTNAQNNKGNKRTIIFDGDVYLGNEETASREENNDNSADEDALLTQALNYQEQTFQQQQVIETRPKSSTNLIEEPPSKKMKSLIQNMFEEDENSDENNQNRNEDEEEEKEANRFLKKRHGLVSLGHLLEEDTTSRDSEEHNQQMDYHMTTKSRHHTSIYIENTDSEGE